ncbi:MAG: asparagine synthase (glutamine-hydrolyzing) [Candidatus Methylomirabilis sp.]
MCGIAGRVNFLSGAPVDRALITRMCDLLVHRGPDGEGTYAEGPVGLGHRRLAIIDLSPAAHQPMTNEDRSLWITFNGEIYNFRELRLGLEAAGHRFRSQSDTEVILHLYEEEGVKCLSRLRGMFAFAIWDSRERTLFLARDRLGKKPLYYLLNGYGIAFASEPKAFLADPSFKPQPNLQAISHYLTYQYVPSPLTAFEGVQKLPPAHYLLVKDGKVFIERYWKLRYGQKRQVTEQEACEELLARLREAVKLRLISDVPLGAFLSGGIDSGTIVALMTELSASPVKTFSIGFEEKEYDELPYARLVAKRYGTDHHEFVVRPQATEVLPKLVWHYNEPFADSSAIPTYYLAQLTRQHVTVALNGDAGDENFAGYDRYRANVLAARYERIPRLLRRSMEALVRAIPAPERSKSLLSRGKRFFEALAEPRERRYARWVSHFHPDLKAQLCTEEFHRAAGGSDSVDLLLDVYRASDATDFIDATLDVDVNTYLPDDLLVKVDIATMAHGLEGRSPMLDHEFMEFCASLPSQMKLRGRIKKYIFKQAVRGLLPREIIERPKMGFGVPLDHWFRNELKEMAHDTLLNPQSLGRGYFRPEVIKRLLDEHVRGVGKWHYQLWNLLMLELWHRTFIDR